MSYLAFENPELLSLAAEISQPFNRLSVNLYSKRWPQEVTLWRPDGSGLKIISVMHDVAERREVGVLRFSSASPPKLGDIDLDVSGSFEGVLAVSKLIILELGTEAESGIALMTTSDTELIIVAGAFPYTLAVRGLPGPHMFEPEYTLDHYMRVRMLPASSPA